MIKVLWNNIELNYDDKIALKSAFNETLDSGVLIIPNTEELSIKRLDEVIIKNDNEEGKVFLIGTFVKEINCFEKPFLYKYTINLVSPTLYLQSIQLPNITMSQPILGEKRTIYYQIKRLIDTFAPEFTISAALQQATSDTIHPEKQFNRSNLWEVINQLLLPLSCVVTVGANKTLGFIYYGTENNEIDYSKIINIVEYSKADEYCSELEMAAENVIDKNPNTFTAVGITPRSSEYVLTVENSQLILERPIYELEKVEVYTGNSNGKSFTVDYAVDDSVYSLKRDSRAWDITKFIVEDSVYATKRVFNQGIKIIDGAYDNNFNNEDCLEYKRLFMSYTEGGTTINNLATTEKSFFGTTVNQLPLELAIQYAMCEYVLKTYPGAKLVARSDDTGFGELDPRTCLFTVTYVTQSGMRFRVRKNVTEELNERVLVDSQSSSYVDKDSLFASEQEKVNRLGNPELAITMKFDNLSELPNVGSYYRGYVLTDYTALIFQNSIDFEGNFTKDYTRLNLFTGINSKRRWTSIAKGSEALSRQDLVLIDLEITKETTSIQDKSPLLTNIVSNIKSGLDKKIKLLATTTNSAGGTETAPATSINGFFRLTPTISTLGTNCLISFQMKSNYSVGVQVVDSASDKYMCKDVRYVDDKGEFKWIKLYLCIDLDDITSVQVGASQALPCVLAPSNEIIDAWRILAMKDNREIYGNDIQLRFKSDNDINVYPALLNDSYLNVWGRIATTLRMFGLTDTIIPKHQDNIKLYSSVIHLKTIDDELNTSGEVQKPTIDSISTWSCWGIVDSKNNILFCVNSNVDKLYFKKGKIKVC